MAALNAQRYNTATRFRRHCASILGVSDGDLLKSADRLQFRDRIGWVSNGNGGGSYSSVDVEILHHDFNGKFNIGSVFRNRILKGVCLFHCFMKFDTDGTL